MKTKTEIKQAIHDYIAKFTILEVTIVILGILSIILAPILQAAGAINILSATLTGDIAAAAIASILAKRTR